MPDLEEVDPVVRQAITFVPAKTLDTVLETALLLEKPIESQLEEKTDLLPKSSSEKSLIHV